MPTIPPSTPGTSTRFWSTYQLAFLAVLAFALVTVTAGVIFGFLQPPPGDGETSQASDAGGDSSESGGQLSAGAGSAQLLGQLPTELHEASGIAVNPESGVAWLHNDDPGAVTLFAIDLEGRLIESHEVPGARVSDLEDLDRAPCPGDQNRSCLYLADTGDNDRARTASQILVVAEPSTPGETLEVLGSAIYTYEDGIGRDIESLAVGDSSVFLVSKGQDGSAEVFALDLESLAPAEGTAAGQSTPVTSVARHVGTLAIDVNDDTNRPTGAAVSPDGTSLAVRTARTVYRFPIDDLGAEPVACPIGFDEPQGEAIDFLDDQRVILTGEAAEEPSAPLLELECPAADAT